MPITINTATRLTKGIMRSSNTVGVLGAIFTIYHKHPLEITTAIAKTVIAIAVRKANLLINAASRSLMSKGIVTAKYSPTNPTYNATGSRKDIRNVPTRLLGSYLPIRRTNGKTTL